MPKFKVEMDNCSKVTISGKEFPILVAYLRNGAPKNVPATYCGGRPRGRPFGAIVAVDKDHIGWSLCYRWDYWSREEAIKRAAGRAMLGVKHWFDVFADYITKEGVLIGDVEKSRLPKLQAVVAGLRAMQEQAIRKFESHK